MKIAVLGAGPVGLLAVHASHLYLEEPEISVYSIMEMSRMPGAQYLHSDIPELTTSEPDGHITYSKLGSRDGYAEKVYGDFAAPCSWDRFEGTVPAWSLQEAYSELWKRYSNTIWDGEIRAELIEKVVEDNDIVFSSINPLGYCVKPDEHEFHWQQVYTREECPQEVPNGTIIYSGDPDDDWYRTANLFSHQSAEYPEKFTGGGKRVRKPLSTTCTCFADDMHRIGRYGVFESELLVDDAFEQVCEVLDAV